MASKHIIPFSDDFKLPAELAALGGDDDWESGQGGGFPVLSIKSKVFHITRGEDRQLITRPDDPDEAAQSIGVIVLRTHKGVARTYYASNYEEGSSDKPDCFSNDGIAPDPAAEVPQSQKCATCPKSQWGSRISESGKKGKACSEVKRLAVANPGQVNDPMLLRVPPTSLRVWDQYVDMLKKRGVTPAQVVTKISFDHDVSHQVLLFKPTGFIDTELATQVAEVRDSAVVRDIIGQGPNSGYAGDPPIATDKPVDGRKAAQKAADEAQPLAGMGEDDDEAPKKETKAKPKPAAKEAKPAPEVEEEIDDDGLGADLENMLGELGLGDDD